MGGEFTAPARSRPGVVRFALGVLCASASLALCACGVLPGMEAKGTSAKVLYSAEPDMRIRVKRNVTAVTVNGAPQLFVRPLGGGKPEFLRAPVRFAGGDGKFTATDAAGTVREYSVSAAVEVHTSENTEESMKPALAVAPIEADGVRFPGFLTLRPNREVGGGVLDVIATMPVESYLPGVLTHELWPNWPRQTFEAQSVAARTYALHERERARREGRMFDVENTTNDQVFGGLTKASKPIEAARATRGMVLTNGGTVLRAYYSSQCGGRPSSAAYVWRTDKGYEFNLSAPLQGKEREHFCNASPLYRWETTRRDDDVSRRLRAWGKAFNHKVAEIGRLRSARVEEFNDAGRPVKYRLTDEKGAEFDLTGEEFRMGCNQEVRDLPAITKETRVHSGDFEVEVFANQVRFRGRGWGHGVGMCQWCAKGMADAGWDWDRMVRAFYPGVTVQKAYE